MYARSLLVGWLLAIGPAWCVGEERDLILVAGQSNAVGYDADPKDLPESPIDQQVLFWWRCGDPPPDDHDSQGRAWSHLQPQPRGKPLSKTAFGEGEKAFGLGRQYGNFAQSAGGFGPEIGLARALAAQEKRPLAIVKAAFSGTGMRTDWNPHDAGDAGKCYRALVAETQAALAAAAEKSIQLRLRALVWVQGESDANEQDAPKYARNLGAMIEALRNDLESPDLAALISVNTRFGDGKNPHLPVVVDAQKHLAETLPRCRFVDPEGAETLGPSHTHFTGKGTLDLGERFAAELLKLEAQP